MTDESDASRRGKSDTAFRTISEVAGELDVPQHVLRFWETKFPQVHPMKRGGGRRYYRPEDVGLLRQIRTLLYSEGYTIKGVQKLLKENNGKLPEGAFVRNAGMSPERRQALQGVLNELQDLRDLLQDTGGDGAPLGSTGETAK